MRDHYDLRLELDGVLVSWAVPKGPTLDPTVRRTAFKVDDHPLEYYDFEGIIPRGSYGGGDVTVWDWGRWLPARAGDPAASLRAGELHVDLEGEKLRGRFALVRRARDGEDNAWLLVKKRDADAVAGWDPADHPRSVKSGRTNDEVAADPELLWRSDLPAAEAAVPLRRDAPDDLPGPTEGELAALDALRDRGTWSVHGRDLAVTNLDKVLFPGRDGEPPVTKRELLRYAACIGPTLVPYLAGRALNLHRYPDGAGTKGFWQKELPAHAPAWLPRWDNPDADPGESVTYLVADEPAALVWAANHGALEWHPWTSRTDAPELPTYALVDLDPGPTTSWAELLALARLHRTAFEHLQLQAFPKVTGRRGLQVWVPIERGPGFDETRGWVQRLSRTVGAVLPDLVSWKWEVADRGGKARLDYTQNAVNKTLVAPWSPRPAPGAPVSVPITWEELDDPALRPDRWTIRDVGDRLRIAGDPFRPLLSLQQRLPQLA